jgi:RNA polymerase sigma factor (sigma-70 family)
LSIITEWRSIESYRSDLLKYCCAITGSAWDGEDLLQETMMRAFIKIPQNEERMIPKSYLFRIASNAWIDRCRKQRIDIDSFTDVNHVAQENPIDLVDVKEAIDILVTHLSQKQQIVILLIDVFQYTASEVANKIETTEGAVKALLSRARAKLKSVNKRPVVMTGEDVTSQEEQEVTEVLVRTYLEAFKNRNPDTIFLLLESNVYTNVVQFNQTYSKKHVRSNTSEIHRNMEIRQRHIVVEGRLAA